MTYKYTIEVKEMSKNQPLDIENGFHARRPVSLNYFKPGFLNYQFRETGFRETPSETSFIISMALKELLNRGKNLEEKILKISVSEK